MDKSVKWVAGAMIVIAVAALLGTKDKAPTSSDEATSKDEQVLQRAAAQVAKAVKDPEKVKLMECMGVQVYKDPQPPGHPPTRSECAELQARNNLPPDDLRDGSNTQTATELLTAEELSLETVHARGMMAVPGAIVCPDFERVGSAYRMFVSYLSDQMARRNRSAEQQKQVDLIYGRREEPYPDVTIYGCEFVPAGIELHVDRSNSVPVVAGVVDGKVVRGVTNPAMIE